MELNLEEERRELAECLKLRETVNEPIWGEVEARRKLVHALEQLEQAWEALEYAGNALRLHGCSSMPVYSVLKALKQQEVG